MECVSEKGIYADRLTWPSVKDSVEGGVAVETRGVAGGAHPNPVD